MPLWTDIIDPVEASGIARAEQYLYEQRWGTLARYLPNVFVPSTYVEFVAGANGLTDVAHYRAFSSPPKIGSGPKGERKTITLPAISRNEPINEQEQMTWESLTEDQQLKSIEKAIRRMVRRIRSMFFSVISRQRRRNSSRGTSFLVIPCCSSTLTSVGRPWQSHPCGNITLSPSIRRYRARKSM